MSRCINSNKCLYFVLGYAAGGACIESLRCSLQLTSRVCTRRFGGRLCRQIVIAQPYVMADAYVMAAICRQFQCSVAPVRASFRLTIRPGGTLAEGCRLWVPFFSESNRELLGKQQGVELMLRIIKERRCIRLFVLKQEHAILLGRMLLRACRSNSTGAFRSCDCVQVLHAAGRQSAGFRVDGFTIELHHLCGKTGPPILVFHVPWKSKGRRP